MRIIETEIASGFGPPLHQRPETETFRVLEGRYLGEIDGTRTLTRSMLSAARGKSSFPDRL